MNHSTKLGALAFGLLLIFFMILPPPSALGAETPAPATQQQGKYKLVGVVNDSEGEPITGAFVVLKNDNTNGTITDVDGKFEITVSPNDVLLVSFIGFATREVSVSKQKVVSITLYEDETALSEAVVTAFGTSQNRETVTGAIQSVRPNDLVVPASNLSTSFAGRLAGVIAYQRSGEPGSNGANFYIRGISTISGATSPLIVMDGVEISSGDLNSIDPEIIESFSILKDATATAMYGSRGANGVMIVKTKSGADLDKPAIGFRVESYVNTPMSRPEFVSAADYMRMYNEAVTNQGTGAVLYTDDEIAGTIAGLDPYIYPNVDWYGELFRNASFNQKANFNIRGGSSRVAYFMNVTVNHETGMQRNRSKEYGMSYGTNLSLVKYAFQNNIDFNMSKSSRISLHLNVQLNDYHGPSTSSSSLYSAIMTVNPVSSPICYPSEEGDTWIKWGYDARSSNSQAATNPMANLVSGYNDYFESTVIANVDYDQKLDFITKGLSYKAMISFKNWTYTSTTRSQGYNVYYLNSYAKDDLTGLYTYDVVSYGEPSQPTMGTSSSTSGDRRIYLQTYLDYTRDFGKHGVNAMLLFNEQEYDSNVPGSSLLSALPERNMGFAARLCYDYDHRYMLEFNAGYNGSENFAKGHRFGFFPSVSLGWNVSSEKFWEPLKDVVSKLKLRASYGLVGNDDYNSTRFIYMAQVTLTGSGSYQTGYGNRTQSYSGPTYDRYENDDITWEVGRKLNAGVDIELFNSLNLTVDAFREIRSNIFQQRESIPNYLGSSGTAVYGNLAKVKNQGIDLSVDYGYQFSKDLIVQFKGTFTFARNEVIEYDEAPGLRPAMSQVGRRLYTYLGYVADGLYIDQADIDASPKSQLGNIAIAPGDIKYVDQPDADGNYDGLITSDDRIELGYPYVPEIVYGFGPSVAWRNWDFSFYMQGQANVSLMMTGFYPFGTQQNRSVMQWIADDYWSEDNQNVNAGYPRLTHYTNDHNNQYSTFWLRSAAFLKLKNLEIGYRFAKGKARIYLSGMNLLTFAPFKLWDPEMGGGAGLSYPNQRTYNIGIQVTL